MTSNKNSNNFLIQGSILAVASIIVRLIGLLYRIPMTRIIGDEGMGTYNIAFEIYNMALIISTYGLPLAVSKLVAARVAKKEHRNAYRIFIFALIFAVIVGLIACATLFFGAEFFATVINGDSYAVLPLQVLAPTILVFSIMGVFRGYYQGKNTMIPTAFSQILEQVINAGVSVAAAYFLMESYNASPDVVAYGAAGGTLGTLAGATAALIFLVFVYLVYHPYLMKQMSKDRTDYQESFKEIGKLLILTIAPVILSQTVYHINGVIDNSMFSKIMMNKEVTSFDRSAFTSNGGIGALYTEENIRTLIGKYGNKYKTLTNVPVAIASSIGAAIVTSIAAAKANGMEKTIHSKTHAAIKFNMVIAIPCAVGMAVLAYPILTLLFPDSHQLDANFLRLGSVAIVFYALSTVSTAILQGINRMKTPVINSAISLGIHIVLVFLMLKFTHLSTYALVIGNVTLALVVSILNWISLEKYLNYRQEIMKTFVIPLVSSGIMGIAAYFIYKGLYALIQKNMISLLITVTISIVIYFALLIFLKGLDEEEIVNVPKGYVILRLLKKVHLM